MAAAIEMRANESKAVQSREIAFELFEVFEIEIMGKCLP
jgi:hypothetical protein